MEVEQALENNSYTHWVPTDGELNTSQNTNSHLFSQDVYKLGIIIIHILQMAKLRYREIHLFSHTPSK